jgi:DNA-binding CsgD family transcriptional regulator/PAS domain-containing protein
MNRDAMSEVLAAIYAAPLNPELWSVALERLSATIGITQASLHEHRLDLNLHRVFAVFGDSLPEGAPLYERDYWRFDEWTKRLSSRFAPGRVFRGHEVWPESAFRRSIFFNEFLLKYDVCEMACIGARDGPERVEGLSIYRGPDEPQFSDDQFNNLAFLAPHLDIALATRRRLLDLEARDCNLEAAFQKTQTAIVLLDSKGKVVMFNNAAKTLLEQRRGLLLNNSSLEAREPQENSSLRILVAQVLSPERTPVSRRGGALRVSRPDRRPLHVQIAPSFSTASSNAGIIVFIADPDRESDLPDRLLKELFQLTSAECRVAIGLLDGKSLAEIADDIQVGKETLRSQLKSVFQKTGTRRQAELVRLLSSVPVITPFRSNEVCDGRKF